MGAHLTYHLLDHLLKDTYFLFMVFSKIKHVLRKTNPQHKGEFFVFVPS